MVFSGKETQKHFNRKEENFDIFDIHRVSQLVKSSPYAKPEEIEELRVAFYVKVIGYSL